jgi:ribosomal-protein-alanine N-acetyltransferase
MSEPVPGGAWSSAQPTVVRPAGRADLDRVAAIERESFSDPWSRYAFERLLGDNRVFFVVASSAAQRGEEPVGRERGEGGEALGYVVAWFVMNEGEIANLAVAPEARRRHVGALLLDAAIQAARTRGVEAMFLEVRASNVAARTLYASRGFAEIARRKRYYRRPVEDALVLRLLLPPP